MKNFSLKRFATLLQYDIVSNYRFYLMQILGIFLYHYFSQLYIVWVNTKDWVSATDSMERFLSSMCITAFWGFTGILLCVTLSRMFCNLSNKAKRINYLMLPASNLEKYLSRMLIFVVGFVIVNPLMFILADVLRMCSLVSMDVHMPLVCSFLPSLWNEFAKNMNDMYAAFVAERGCFTAVVATIHVVCMGAFGCMLYVVGSLFFSKNAFLKTTSLLLIAGFILGISLPQRNVNTEYNYVLGAIVTFTLFVSTLLFTYYKFKNMVVIKRKLFKFKRS